jgi:toxin FitB
MFFPNSIDGVTQNPPVKQWLETADSSSLHASVLTLAEMRFGVELLPSSKRRTQLEEWLGRELPAWFDGRVLPVDTRIADRWGVLRAQAQVKGRPLSVVDGLLAATAVEHRSHPGIAQYGRLRGCRAYRG